MITTTVSLYLLFFAIAVNTYEFPHLDGIKSKTSPSVQETAVKDLIERILPDHVDKFKVTIDQHLGSEKLDTYRITKIRHLENEQIEIVGSDGVAAATALNYYLKYYCNCQITWSNQQLNLPLTLPDVNITVTSNDRFRYYQNVCTTSYSMVWWDWPQWEKHIDWMVLNSFNLVLAFNAQEAIWKKVYLSLNLTETEIDGHFAGPAFLSWSRMGNIRGWGGPLSENWHQRSLYLQKQILTRMREFGIIPVLPAFAGHVPRELKRVFPDVKMDKVPSWNNFNDTYCCPFLLDPTSSLFKTIGSMFMTEMINTFGTEHVYNCDTFNENTPVNSSESYIRDMGKSVFDAMTSVDPQAIWVMQNWLFVHEFFFWTESRAKALLTSIPIGRMLVLDLQSEQFPQYDRLQSYYGQPYIWCMLHDFGGTLGMFGSISIINQRVIEARNEKNSTMVGTGITPEGIFQNYMVYDLMMEMSWRKTPTDLYKWLSDYATRRYGAKNEKTTRFWQILGNSIYNYTGMHRVRSKYAVCKSPRMKLSTFIWYNPCELLQAWTLLLTSSEMFKDSEGYLHDLVDATRQVLQVLGDKYYRKIVKAFNKKNLDDFQSAQKVFLSIIAYMDNILGTNKDFLLGAWIKLAKDAAANDEERVIFEYNARNQISLWGPNGEIKDYATKQWAGVSAQLFYKRWQLYLNAAALSIFHKRPFNETETMQRVFEQVEEPFTFDRTFVPDYPIGDTIQSANIIYGQEWVKNAFKECNEFGGTPTPIRKFFARSVSEQIDRILSSSNVDPNVIVVERQTPRSMN